MRIEKSGTMVLTKDDCVAMGFEFKGRSDHPDAKAAALRWAISRLEWELEQCASSVQEES